MRLVLAGIALSVSTLASAQATLDSGIAPGSSGISAVGGYALTGTISVADHNVMHYRQAARRIVNDYQQAKQDAGGSLAPEQEAEFARQYRSLKVRAYHDGVRL